MVPVDSCPYKEGGKTYGIASIDSPFHRFLLFDDEIWLR
jgi:hypothetical protein